MEEKKFNISKLCAILLPFIIFLGGLGMMLYSERITMKQFHQLAPVIIIANILLVCKIQLSDIIKKFQMDMHCFQLSEIALSAFLAALAIQLFNKKDILELPYLLNEYPSLRDLPYLFLHLLILGVVISGITTAINLVLVKILLKKETTDNGHNIIILPISYMVGLIGYALYVLLFMTRALS